jgi:phosphate-selective porin
MARLFAQIPVLILLAASAQAAGTPRLNGIKKIAIAIAADPDGDFNTQRVRASVENRLRSAGLKIDPKSRSHLNVVMSVSIIRTDSGANVGYAYSIHLDLTQQVYLAHNPNLLTEAVTWQTMSLGTASSAELSRKCEQVIARRVEEFVGVYLAGTGE